MRGPLARGKGSVSPSRRFGESGREMSDAEGFAAGVTRHQRWDGMGCRCAFAQRSAWSRTEWLAARFRRVRDRRLDELSVSVSRDRSETLTIPLCVVRHITYQYSSATHRIASPILYTYNVQYTSLSYPPTQTDQSITLLPSPTSPKPPGPLAPHKHKQPPSPD